MQNWSHAIAGGSLLSLNNHQHSLSIQSYGQIPGEWQVPATGLLGESVCWYNRVFLSLSDWSAKVHIKALLQQCTQSTSKGVHKNVSPPLPATLNSVEGVQWAAWGGERATQTNAGEWQVCICPYQQAPISLTNPWNKRVLFWLTAIKKIIIVMMFLSRQQSCDNVVWWWLSHEC